MNYTSLFYWLVVADNARSLFIVLIIIFTAVAGISTLCYFISSSTAGYNGQSKDDEQNQAMARKWIWWSYPFAIFFWFLLIFTPSKKDALLIVAGGQTLNFLANDKSAKQIPSELSNFVLTEVKNLAADAKVDLGIANQKDKILEKAKKMTTEELMAEMKKDTTFAKVILDKNE
jgi:hypothetical protein